ncbi:MAG: ATP-grasp domain-containing protein [Bdellovibrionales bacterium]
MKYAFLTCDDLSDYIIDDDLAIDAFSEVFPNDQLEVVSWSKPEVNWADYDFAVIRTTWDYTARLDEFLSVLQKIEKSGCKLLNPLSTVEWNSKKTYLKELYKKGLPVLTSIFLEKENIASIKKKVLSWSEEKVVLKPVVGAGAGLIEVLDKDQLLEKLLDLPNWSNWFIQPFAEGVLEGERSFLFFNGEFSHSVIKKPKSGDFRVQEEHGGSTQLYDAPEEEKELAKKVVDSFGSDLLYVRVDFMPTTDGLKIIELELVEPSLYFRIDPPSAYRFLEALDDKTKG